MAEGVIDHLQSVEVDEQHRRASAITRGALHQQHEIAHEAAPVGQFHQHILMGQRIKLIDALLQLGDPRAQLAQFVQQPSAVRDIRYMVRHCPPTFSVSPAIA